MEENKTSNEAYCPIYLTGLRDSMDLLSGKWKMRIIGSLIFGKKRFMELIGHVEGIAAKMLSSELQHLELNGLVKRIVLNTKPIMVEYELTEYGHSLKPIIDQMATWGIQHRIRVNQRPERQGSEV
ncbi:hypothetical protein A0257_22875 (plasmid) [Hymenobacter psoromatis]|nr:hypothetical protein A0257_22875 [Hymenobacter psoromatis]